MTYRPEASGDPRLPWPDAWTVRRARDAYLAENGFTVPGYDARWTFAKVFGIRWRVPNTPRHRVGIMFHDLHHVATGYSTDLAGEAEVSAWEIRGGVAASGLYVSLIVVSIAMAGIVIAPRRLRAAYGAAARARTLFDGHIAYDALLSMTVGELRATLGVPAGGLVRAPRELHDDAPMTPADPYAAIPT